MGETMQFQFNLEQFFPRPQFHLLEPVRDYKARHASTLLTFDAVVDAIDRIEAKRRAKTETE